MSAQLNSQFHNPESGRTVSHPKKVLNSFIDPSNPQQIRFSQLSQWYGDMNLNTFTTTSNSTAGKH